MNAKDVLVKMLEINKIIIKNFENINEEKAEAILTLCKSFEDELSNIIAKEKIEIKPKAHRKHKRKVTPNEELIKKLAKMSEDEIRSEFMDTSKYPTIDSIKNAVRGLIPSSTLSKIKRRETLIKHIIKAITAYEQFRL